MPPEPSRNYWDACVFLSYLNGVEDRLPTLDALLNESARPESDREIVTSTYTVTEVAYVVHEKTGQALDAEVEANIDALWTDRYAVKLIDFHEGIARDARSLIRGAVASGTSLKPGDAVTLRAPGRSAAPSFTPTRRIFRATRPSPDSRSASRTSRKASLRSELLALGRCR